MGHILKYYWIKIKKYIKSYLLEFICIKQVMEYHLYNDIYCKCYQCHVMSLSDNLLVKQGNKK